LTIAMVGFRGNFAANALTFVVSAVLLIGLPRLGTAKSVAQTRTSLSHGISAMFHRSQLRETLYLALQVSIAGGFVLVATVDFIKGQLALSDASYAWAMAAYGIGSVAGAGLYGRCNARSRNRFVNAAAPLMVLALVGAGFFHRFEPLLLAWALAGAGQCVLGIRGNELLAANSDPVERSHIYAAHFSLSHVGWGLTYPLAGFLVTAVGFEFGAYVFAGLLGIVAVPIWIARMRPAAVHNESNDAMHGHAHHVFDPPGDYHVHEHRHGDMVHSHPHRHGIPHDHAN